MPKIKNETLLNSITWFERKDDYHRVMKFSGMAAWVAPEISFWTFASYEVMIPAILEECRAISIPQFKLLDCTWNGIDSIASCVIGLSQLADAQTHRQLATKISGVANLTSGIQLMVLTILLSPFLPIAFAAAAANDFVLSLDPLIYAIRRHWDFDFWLQDSFYQLNKLIQDEKALKEELSDFQQKIDNTENLTNVSKIRADFVVLRKTARLEKISGQIVGLEQDMCCRLAYQKHQKGLSSKTHLMVNERVSPDSKLAGVLVEQSAVSFDTLKRERILSEETRKELKRRSLNTAIFAMAAIGWVLFCVPGLQVPAAIIISITIALYLSKNIHELIHLVSKYLKNEPEVQDDIQPLVQDNVIVSLDTAEPRLLEGGTPIDNACDSDSSGEVMIEAETDDETDGEHETKVLFLNP